MSDYIDRQAAVDAVNQYISQFDAIDANFLDGLKTAINIVKKLPSADRWIPCTERLPDEGEEVFVYLFGESPYIAWFDGLQWKTEDFEVDEEYAPVAWMPLPNPYKENT